MAWSPDGARLVTGDDAGTVGVWKVDNQSRPVPIIQYHEKKARVTHVVVPPREDALAAMPFGSAASNGGVEDASPGGIQQTTPFYYALAVDPTGEGGARKGVVACADDAGNSSRLYETDAEAAAMLHYDGKGHVVTVGLDSMLSIHEATDGGAMWRCQTQMKLPSEGASKVVWATPGTLAVCNEKDPSCAVRMFNLATGENYALLPSQQGRADGGGAGSPTPQGGPQDPSGWRITCLAFNDKMSVLACGQRGGHVTLFRHLGVPPAPKPGEDDPAPEDAWQNMAGINVAGRLSQIAWGPQMRLLGALGSDGCSVCKKVRLHDKVREGISVVQVSADKVMVETVDGSRPPAALQLEMQATGADATDRHLLVWNSRHAEVHEVTNSGFLPVANFPASSAMAIHRESVFRAGASMVEVCTLAGKVKETLVYDEAHGQVEHIDVNKDFLAVSTGGGFIKLWRLSGRSPKSHGPTGGKKLENIPGVPEGSSVDSIRVNSNGTKVSVLFALPGAATTHTVLAVYDVDTDAFRTFDFAQTGRVPESHAWDREVSLMLGVQTVAGSTSEGGDTDGDTDGDTAPGEKNLRKEAKTPGLVVYTMFSAPEGILLQESHPIPAGFESLLGLSVPSLYVCKKAAAADGSGVCFSVTMRDFTGMENVDPATKSSLLEFNFHLATNNQDEAFKAIKAIKNPAVWESMAHMCIKNKRLDVAEMCLGNMGHVRGARALRDAAQEPELDARVATVAVHLGLTDEAEHLYAKCGRFDLLNRLYQAMGRWQEAIAVATKHDRIHLKTTHYNHAKHLESMGELQGAIGAYEESGNAAVEVPRLLFERGMIDDLEAYISRANNPKMTKWWARYCESVSEFEKALHGYQAANDYLSLVRVYCAQGDFQVAAEIVEECNDPAAAFHLARTFEAQDATAEAVRYFALAGRHGHAARLARAAGMEAELMNLALQSPPEMMLDSAQYFQERGQPEKAVTLYQKAGNLKRAMELCFNAQLFEPLATLTEAIGSESNADPDLLARCAKYFLEHNQYAKAVDLFIKGKQYEHGLQLALDHDVTVTEEMAEAMTPAKGEVDDAERKQLLLMVAKVCKQQGSYHLSCKKYTQAGEKVKAMKALLKSGDTEKIIFFAGVSRNRDIYVMSANYLQTLDWHNDAEIMKSIINFYSKARAVESLAGFYESCAQIEIDEYRDYEKALGALREALKHLQKSRTEDKAEQVEALSARINMVTRFVQARKLIQEDPHEMVRICTEILNDPRIGANEIESSIRIGDVFALLIEYWYAQGNAQQAYTLVEQMKDRGIVVAPYLDGEMVKSIYREMGVEVEQPRGRGGSGGGGAGEVDSDGEEFMEEDIPIDDDD